MSKPQGGNGSGFGFTPSNYSSHGKSYTHTHSSHGSDSRSKYSSEHYKRHFHHHSRYQPQSRDTHPRKSKKNSKISIGYKEDHDDPRQSDYYYQSNNEGYSRSHESNKKKYRHYLGQIPSHDSYKHVEYSDRDKDKECNRSYSRSSYSEQQEHQEHQDLIDEKKEYVAPPMQRQPEIEIERKEEEMEIEPIANRIEVSSIERFPVKQEAPRTEFIPTILEREKDKDKEQKVQIIREEEKKEVPKVSTVPLKVENTVNVFQQEKKQEGVVNQPIVVEDDEPMIPETNTKKSLVVRLSELRQELEKPLSISDKLEDLKVEQNAEVTMKPSFLSSSACFKLGGKYGKSLHGEQWQADPKQMKNEICGFIASDNQRLECERKEISEKYSTTKVKTEDEEMKEDKKEPQRIVPHVFYWAKVEPLSTELKAVCKRSKQVEIDRKKVELDEAKQSRMVAESKLALSLSELRAKITDLKLNKNMRSYT